MKERLSNITGTSPKLFAEMIMEVCDAPMGDYKLGVSRLFLRHRAAQVLESLEPLQPSVLEPLVRTKVSAFWEAASRIRDRLAAPAACSNYHSIDTMSYTHIHARSALRSLLRDDGP